MDNNLYAFFERQTSIYAKRSAVAFHPRYRTLTWSYGELSEHALNIAGALSAKGIGAGDRVLLYAPNSPHWVAAFFAILARSSIVIPLNPRSTPEQLERIVRSSEPALLLGSARPRWPAGAIDSLDLEAAAQAPSAPVAELSGRMARPRDLAEIVYTSGTTGEPKGVMLSHGNLLSNIEGLSRMVRLSPSDHVLSIVPLFHMYAQMVGMLYPLAHGAAITYVAAPSTRAIVQALASTPATHMVVVPEFLKTVMERIEHDLARVPSVIRPFLRGHVRRRISKTLHTVASSGAPLDPDIETKWRALGIEILQGYGLTETSPAITSNSYDRHGIGSVGTPLPNVKVKIAADGEILVKGPCVFTGYFRDPERTREAFTDGWFKTDDAGKFDPEGFLYVFGRKKYMILGPGGENVFPEDIEAELNKIHGVKDSTVVGIEKNGFTVIHAVLLLEQGEPAAIIAEANRHLAPHQRIVSWSRWPDSDFPRSATRKAKKDDVIKWLKTKETGKPVQGCGATTRLARVIAEVTKQDPRTIDGSTRLMRDLELDSLMRMELVSRIEEEWNIALEEHWINDETTVAELEHFLTRGQHGTPAVAKYPRWSLSKWATTLRPIARSLFFSSWILRLCNVRVCGAHHLEGVKAPAIFMANHRSFLDGAVAIIAMPHAFRRRLAVAASIETVYSDFWWFAPLADLALNTYPFATRIREDIRPSLEYTSRLLDDGWNVLVFPEGGLNRTKEPMQPLKRGAGVLAMEMAAPIIPMVILGTEIIVPPDALFPRRRGVVEVRFGPPLRFPPTQTHGEATRMIGQAIRRLIVEET